ncbi:hypothetical protein HETIRDRAFT_164152 [Heterobasidion irregulare TC 32-1]|uniref:Uncharacterized protein n=1 Tax=Heterobasidion irregulare (strain TC 32-1) TaxID=747525 RepID=W4JX89_HETIT|nr:uncharacterized protein HETIRDRAFT_164152 [Heterobasidion irregulare TC 32-1]ETW78177.1 hypothetical protein HETIRDRAFT_164152 [Heterobasidion irregulare TC 32-1]
MPSISTSSAAPRISSLLRRLPFYNRGPAMTSAQLLEKKLAKALISLKNPPTMRERVKRMGDRCFEKVRHVKKTGGSSNVVEREAPIWVDRSGYVTVTFVADGEHELQFSSSPVRIKTPVRLVESVIAPDTTALHPESNDPFPSKLSGEENMRQIDLLLTMAQNTFSDDKHSTPVDTITLEACDIASGGSSCEPPSSPKPIQHPDVTMGMGFDVLAFLKELGEMSEAEAQSRCLYASQSMEHEQEQDVHLQELWAQFMHFPEVAPAEIPSPILEPIPIIQVNGQEVEIFDIDAIWAEAIAVKKARGPEVEVFTELW